MSTHIRIGLVVALTMFVACAYTPSVHADKKGGSNSSSNSDDKKKDKDDDQDNQRQGRNRDRNDDQKSSNQQVQNFIQGGSNKQGKSNNKKDDSDNDSQVQGNNPQNNQFQKQLQGQNFQKQSQFQNLQKQNNPQINVQKQINQNDWAKKNKPNQKDMQNWVVKFGGPKPFSNQWYKDHPKAWHYKHHDNDDAWKVITAAGVLGFLGWEAYHPRTRRDLRAVALRPHFRAIARRDHRSEPRRLDAARRVFAHGRPR